MTASVLYLKESLWPGVGVGAQEQRQGNNRGFCTKTGKKWQLRPRYSSAGGAKTSDS